MAESSRKRPRDFACDGDEPAPKRSCTDSIFVWLPLAQIWRMRSGQDSAQIAPGTSLDDYKPLWDIARELGSTLDYNFLTEQGYLVARNVLPPERIAELKRDLVRDMRAVKPGSKFDPEDAKTFTSDNLPPSINGVHDFPMCPWLPALISARTECDDIIFAFLCLFAFLLEGRVEVPRDYAGPTEPDDPPLRTDDKLIVRGNLRGWAGSLVSSLDRYNVSVGKKGTKEKRWHHIDQGIAKRGVWVWQSFLCLTPQSRDRGSLVAYAGSHLRQDSFVDGLSAADKKKYAGKGDWIMLAGNAAAERHYAGCAETYVEANPGDLVLWESRTVHQGHKPSSDRYARMVIYTCYAPRAWASAEDFAKKQQALRELRTTTHWPYAVVLCPPSPKHRGSKAGYAVLKTREVIAAHALTPLQERIFGIR